jgi:histidine kinase/DNA gyrase B/HSP90-like ATPase
MNGTTPTDGVLDVNIRPDVTILSVLQHLNYRPWFAIAEFVDNSLQSSIRYSRELRSADGDRFRLRVYIEIDPDEPGRIVVRDNAAGIAASDFPRAFRPAEVPADRSGLSEFGMGMKSAACWFARKWSVRTKALGEDVERTIAFNIEDIVTHRKDHIVATVRAAARGDHYTEVVLQDLHHPPKGRALGKIKEHLASIYREFLRAGSLELYFRGDPLEFKDPAILIASDYRDTTAPHQEWKKIIDFDFGEGQRVRGFAALREPASTPYAGFALFRRGRLVEGSADETYRPATIFGNSNSYRYQRLFGELHLEGFEVSHTKDGFRWEEYEDVFLDLLKEELERGPLNLLDQAEGHRTRATKKSIAAKAKAATDSVAEIVETDLPPIIDEAAENKDDLGPLPNAIPASAYEVSTRTIELDCQNQRWDLTIRTSVDPAKGDWLEIGERHVRRHDGGEVIRTLTIDVSLSHPFVTGFVGANNENVELIVRMAAAIALSLVLAEDATGVSPAFALHFVNVLLRDALSRTRDGNYRNS